MRLRERFARRPAPPTGAPTVAARAVPLLRERGAFASAAGADAAEAWVPDPHGPFVSSRVNGTSLHAPVLETGVDAHVVLAGRHLTRLRVDGPVDRRLVLLGLANLVHDGHVPADLAAETRVELKAALHTEKRLGPVTLYLTHPVRVITSSTPGRHHIYVDALMDFTASVRMAQALGFVDTGFVHAAERRGFWAARL